MRSRTKGSFSEVFRDAQIKPWPMAASGKQHSLHTFKLIRSISIFHTWRLAMQFAEHKGASRLISDRAVQNPSRQFLSFPSHLCDGENEPIARTNRGYSSRTARNQRAAPRTFGRYPGHLTQALEPAQHFGSTVDPHQGPGTQGRKSPSTKERLIIRFGAPSQCTPSSLATNSATNSSGESQQFDTTGSGLSSCEKTKLSMHIRKEDQEAFMTGSGRHGANGALHKEHHTRIQGAPALLHPQDEDDNMGPNGRNSQAAPASALRAVRPPQANEG